MKEADSVVKKECAYCGSTNCVSFCSEYGDYLCSKHKNQLKFKGHFYKTLKEPNDYKIMDNNTVCIYAYKKCNNKKELCKILVDIDDLDRVKGIRWSISYGYAHNGKLGPMHRYLLRCTDKNLVVDHINHNTLDNRKSNLRIVTRQQNNWNLRSNTGTSKFKGVRLIERDNKYVFYASNIVYNKKSIFLGYYNTELEAAYAYNLHVKDYFGEFAYLNEFTEDELEELQKLLPLQTVYEHSKANATSKYKYISYCKSIKRWCYGRTINKIRYRKSTFLTEEEAYNAYIERMKEIGVEP